MATLYLVRHGQASFGTDDYDRLSELGWQQSRWLGEHFSAQGLRFARVITGGMRRHKETLAGIREGMAATNIRFEQAAEEHLGLNEYDGHKILTAKLKSLGQTVPSEKDLASDRRTYFKLLREALYDWAAESTAAEDHPTFAQFRAGVESAMQLACQDSNLSGPVLVVSSGGPISNAVGSVLRVPPSVTVDLNLQTRNASYSQFAFNQSTLSLMSFNHTPHLERSDRLGAVTYS
jgi:broad specificity phosphatase PhoE